MSLEVYIAVCRINNAIGRSSSEVLQISNANFTRGLIRYLTIQMPKSERIAVMAIFAGLPRALQNGASEFTQLTQA